MDSEKIDWIVSSTLTPDEEDSGTEDTGMDHHLLSSSRLFDVPLVLVVFLSIAYGAVSLAAVIGNSAVLWIVVRSQRLRTVTNVFIANLATADILIGALAIPFQFMDALLQRWILPHFMCPFCTVVQIISVNVSIFTLAAIAAERYLVVSHLLSLRISRKGAEGIIVLIWIVAAIFAAPAGLALQVTRVPDVDSKLLQRLLSREHHVVSANLSLPFKFVCGNRGLDPLLWKWYNRTLVLIQYVGPVCVLLFAYGKMGMLLRGPSGGVSSAATPPSGAKHQQMHVSDRSPSPAETSTRDPQASASEIELSVHSNTRQLVRGRSGSSSGIGGQKAVDAGSGTGVLAAAAGGNGSTSLTANSEYIAASRRRVLKTLIIVVALFALCWLPLQSYTMLQDFFPHINQYRYINVIWFVCHFLAMSNSCLNPFVYAFYTLN